MWGSFLLEAPQERTCDVVPYRYSYNGINLRVARWLRCWHCRLIDTRSWVRVAHAACWYWGAGSPQCSGGLSPGPFCVEFACSPRVHKGVPPLKTPTEKHAKTEHSPVRP